MKRVLVLFVMLFTVSIVATAQQQSAGQPAPMPTPAQLFAALPVVLQFVVGLSCGVVTLASALANVFPQAQWLHKLALNGQKVQTAAQKLESVIPGGGTQPPAANGAH